MIPVMVVNNSQRRQKYFLMRPLKKFSMSVFLSMLLLSGAFDLQVWAVTGGSDGIADRFNELVPDMALDFPFELDAFQKEVLIICY